MRQINFPFAKIDKVYKNYLVTDHLYFTMTRGFFFVNFFFFAVFDDFSK